MSSFDSCFNQRFVLDTVFGQQLFGEAVDVKWIGDSSWLSYYSLVNLFLMFFFLFLGFYKAESVSLTFKRLSLLLWQISIAMVALSVTITGLTRWTFFWATLHSLTEFFMLFAMIKTSIKIPSRSTFNLCFFFFVGIYYMIDLILALSLDMDSAYFVVAFMGAPVDFSTFFGWVVMFFQKKIRIFPAFAFSFHIIYIILVFFNCFFPPWGRIAGLALNTLAIFFASLPANEDSWRFADLIHQMTTSDSGIRVKSDISDARSRSNTGSSTNSQHPMIGVHREPEVEVETEDEETQEMSQMV